MKLLILVNRSDVVEIETWCQSEGRIGTRRDWILRDSATNEVIGRATRFAKTLLLFICSLPSINILMQITDISCTTVTPIYVAYLVI